MSDELAIVKYERNLAQPVGNEDNLAALIASQERALVPVMLKTSGLTLPQVVSMANSAARRNPKIYECAAETIVTTVLDMVQFNWNPHPVYRHCHLVPRWNGKMQRMELTLQSGYGGLAELAQRACNCTFTWGVIYGGEAFEELGGSRSEIRHTPNLSGDRGDKNVVGFWCEATYPDGRKAHRVMNVEEVNKHKARTTSRDKQGNVVGPWITDWQAMGLKTCLLDLTKLLSKSPESSKMLERAFELEMAAENVDRAGERVARKQAATQALKDQLAESPTPTSAPAEPAAAQPAASIRGNVKAMLLALDSNDAEARKQILAQVYREVAGKDLAWKDGKPVVESEFREQVNDRLWVLVKQREAAHGENEA